jgi:hypothetical protein
MSRFAGIESELIIKGVAGSSISSAIDLSVLCLGSIAVEAKGPFKREIISTGGRLTCRPQSDSFTPIGLNVNKDPNI